MMAKNWLRRAQEGGFLLRSYHTGIRNQVQLTKDPQLTASYIHGAASMIQSESKVREDVWNSLRNTAGSTMAEHHL